jgi:hypothetical protein
MVDFSFLFCCEGAGTTRVPRGDDIGSNRGDDPRDRRGRGRSRTPRKNVNGRFDDNIRVGSPHRRPRGPDGSQDRGSTSSGNSTDHTEPIFQSGETPFMGFCWPSGHSAHEQKSEKLSQLDESLSLLSHLWAKKRRATKLSPQRQRTSKKKENSKNNIVLIGHNKSLQRDTLEKKEIRQTTEEIKDARNDHGPTTLVGSMHAYSQWFTDASAATQRTRGGRKDDIGEQLIFDNDDTQWKSTISDVVMDIDLQSIDLSTVSNQVDGSVEITADDETRDESSIGETNRAVVENMATGNPSICLSTKTKPKGEVPKSSSKFFRGKMSSVSRLVYGRRIANRPHPDKNKQL